MSALKYAPEHHDFKTLFASLATIPTHDPARYETTDGFDNPKCTNGDRASFATGALDAFQKICNTDEDIKPPLPTSSVTCSISSMRTIATRCPCSTRESTPSSARQGRSAPFVIIHEIRGSTFRKNPLKPLLPTFVDFFAGSGLVTQGVKHAFAPVWVNDICPRKAAMDTANHGAGHFHHQRLLGGDQFQDSSHQGQCPRLQEFQKLPHQNPLLLRQALPRSIKFYEEPKLSSSCPDCFHSYVVSLKPRVSQSKSHSTMIPNTIAALATLVALTSCQVAKTDHAACSNMPPYKGSAAFERMKTLVGKWSGESSEMGKMNTEFRLIAGDSVIEERFAGGTPMEMLSVYHDVNGKLTMTHYCMLRNQPRMKLTKSTADSLTFDLAPTPGLNPAKDMHMHGATYTFIDANHFKLDGVSWENGKSSPCGPAMIFTRK